jgi:peroxiredoxin Q/BCP
MLKKILKRLIGGGTERETRLLEPGATAPDFSVRSHDGKTIRLANLRGRKVLLWFYPKADTPGCTIEGNALRDRQEDFDRKNVQILGCSFDPEAENQAFAEKFGYRFPLLCDTERKIGMAYGACSAPSDAHAKRISYVIDENGKVAHVLPKVDPSTHGAEILELLSR